MKKWTCIQVVHHKDVGKVIEEHQKVGWNLYTYQAAGHHPNITHYLLFEREE